MTIYDVRQISTPISATDVVSLTINNSTDANPLPSDITRDLQLVTFSVNSNQVVRAYYGTNPNDSLKRTRLIDVNGVNAGYLSDNCGITLKSKTDVFQYTWGTLPLPTPMMIGATSVNPSGNSFLGSSDSTEIVQLINNFTYNVYELNALFNLAPIPDLIVPPTLVSEITQTTLDAQFAPQIVFNANSGGLGTMTYNFNMTAQANPTTWDYTISVVNGTTIQNGVTFARTMTIQDNISEFSTTYYMTADIIFNLYPTCDIFFFGMDDEPLHIGNEDVTNVYALAPFNPTSVLP